MHFLIPADLAPLIALVLRLYDYLCVMSTIPTMNPSLNMQNVNTKSKTTLNSGGGGIGAITVKSNRGHASPFKADKAMLSTEISRIGKDETR